MKRQLLSAVLSTATLTASAAILSALPPPAAFLAHSVIEISQRRDHAEIAAHGENNLAGFHFFQAWRAGDDAGLSEADRNIRRASGALVSWPEYEDALQNAILEKWRTIERLSDRAFYRYAEDGKTNLYKLINWRLLDIAKKRKRLTLLPDENERPRRHSDLLTVRRDTEEQIRKCCWYMREHAEKHAADFDGPRYGEEALAILVLFSERPETWCDVDCKKRKALSQIITAIKNGLGLSRKDAERGFRALGSILPLDFPAYILSRT